MNVGISTVIISGTLTAVALIFLLIRLRARIRTARNLGADDALLIAAWILSVSYTLLTVATLYHGFGEHQDSLSVADAVFAAKMVFAQVLTYNISITLCKLSILTQLLRFFIDRPFRLTCFGLMTLNVVYILATLLTFIFACRPVHYFWDRRANGVGKCLNYSISWYVMTAFGILTDMIICILPIPVLKHLNLAPRQKNGLLLVFALGGCTCIAAIIRLKAVYTAASSTDPSFYWPAVVVWSSVELNLGMICACLPTIGPVIAHFYFKASGSSAGTRSQFSQPQLNTIPDDEFVYVANMSATSTVVDEMREKPYDEVHLHGMREVNGKGGYHTVPPGTSEVNGKGGYHTVPLE